MVFLLHVMLLKCTSTADLTPLPLAHSEIHRHCSVVYFYFCSRKIETGHLLTSIPCFSVGILVLPIKPTCNHFLPHFFSLA
ncbi:hypothetical protein LI328DRAFT_129915 [Trichoderma asperelloides]|nr:hypothetical protein LI328DRAFT_129915 [Trichoderma asperelloides]